MRPDGWTKKCAEFLVLFEVPYGLAICVGAQFWSLVTSSFLYGTIYIVEIFNLTN